MYPSRQKFGQAHEGVGPEGWRERVVRREGTRVPLLLECEHHSGPDGGPRDGWGVGGVEIGGDQMWEPRREIPRGRSKGES